VVVVVELPKANAPVVVVVVVVELPKTKAPVVVVVVAAVARPIVPVQVAPIGQHAICKSQHLQDSDGVPY
jgi:hypothetical protein